MRVVHVITRMIIGGAQENTLFNCLDLIRDFGDEVLLVTGPANGPEGELLGQGRGEGLRVRLVPALQRAIHPLRDRAAYYDLIRVIREFRPDVVHTHSAKAGFLGRAAAWKCNVPVVIHTIHGAPFHPYQNALQRHFFIQLERWAARRCHHMICVADAMTELMVRARVADATQFTTIYSGMDVEPFVNANQHRQQARAALGFQSQHVVFGKIARLFPLKGHEYLIEAAHQVLAKNRNCRFLIVGDGILRRQWEQRIAELQLEEYFHFAGLVDPNQIPYFMSAMDAVVHTSLREGLARTLPQALIAAKPVISFDVDGAREVTIPDETGFLVPPKSVPDLVRAILKLAEDDVLRTRLGKGGAGRFTEQFRHQSMTRRIREIYERFLP